MNNFLYYDAFSALLRYLKFSETMDSNHDNIEKKITDKISLSGILQNEEKVELSDLIPKALNIKEVLDIRELLYNSLFAHLNISFEQELKLIIAVKAYIWYKEDDKRNNQCKQEKDKTYRNLFEKNEKLDPKKIEAFCVEYRKKRRIKQKYKNTFDYVTNYVDNKIIKAMKISPKTFNRVLQGKSNKIEYLAAICRCLDLDEYISTNLIRRAGHDISPFSQDERLRKLYYLFMLPPLPIFKNDDYMEAFEIFCKELIINDFNLVSTRSQSNHTLLSESKKEEI